MRAGTSEIHLTPLEQGLLSLLVANEGAVLSQNTILDALWGAGFMSNSNIVERHLRLAAPETSERPGASAMYRDGARSGLSVRLSQRHPNEGQR